MSVAVSIFDGSFCVKLSWFAGITIAGLMLSSTSAAFQAQAPQTGLKPILKNASQTSGTTSVQKPKITKLTLTGRFHLVTGTSKGVLILKAEIPKGSCIYSLTQKGQPQASKITVTSSNQFKTNGNFAADRYPKVIKNDPVFNNRIEKHTELVQFFAPIEIQPGVNPKDVRVEIVFDGLCCSDAGTCMPVRERKVVAQFGGYYDQEAKKRAASPNFRR